MFLLPNQVEYFFYFKRTYSYECNFGQKRFRILNKSGYTLYYFFQNQTEIEIKRSPLYYTRTRGLFRECYPGEREKAPFLQEKKDRISKFI